MDETVGLLRKLSTEQLMLLNCGVGEDSWESLGLHNFSSKEQVSFNFMAAVNIYIDFGAQKIKSVTVSTVSPSIFHEVMGPDAMILVFWMLSSRPGFSLSSFTLINMLFSFLHFLPLEWYYLHILGCWNFSWQSWFQLVIHPVCHFTWCTLHRR